MADANPTVAIVGAGLTGLLVAQALRKQGFRVTVYDREAGLDARPRDWTIMLHWALPTMLALLPDNVRALVEAGSAYCTPNVDYSVPFHESLAVYSGVSGDLLFASPMPGSRRVSRRRLRAVLATGIDVHWGRAVQDIASDADGVTLVFEDGRARADFVLAADGASSRVRALLVGADEARTVGSGLLFATVVCKYADAAATKRVTDLHPVCALSMGAGSVTAAGVLYSTAPDGAPLPVDDWTMFLVKIWPDDGTRTKDSAEVVRLVKASPTTTGLAPALAAHFAAVPDDGSAVGYLDEMKYWTSADADLPQTHDARVTLAGDAAHPMLVYRGQGFQHAIVDAENYVATLTKLRDDGWRADARREAFAAFNREMLERGGVAVRQSVAEADKSFDAQQVANMMMAKQGHARSA